MEEDNNDIHFNGNNLSPFIKAQLFRLGTILGSFIVGYFLFGKSRGCMDFYRIMSNRVSVGGEICKAGI